MKQIKLIAVMLILIVQMTYAQSFSGGTGTVADPYKISTGTDLINISKKLSSNYVMMNNIALDPTIVYDDAVTPEGGWIPLGNSTSKFTGTFNGNGYKISKLNLERGYTGNYAGLFGYIEDAIISNLGVEVQLVEGVSYTGALAGYVGDGSIIKDCYSTGTVKGHEYVGGLVGYVKYATVQTSYSRATVNGTSYVGGLVGYGSTYATIENCFAHGAVKTTTKDGGGLVGLLGSNCQVIKSYSIGAVTGGAAVKDLGGLIGINYGIVTSSFYDGQTSGQSDVGKGVPKSVELIRPPTFINESWNLDTVWAMNDDVYDKLPTFHWDIDFEFGSGTASDPYQIFDVVDLMKVKFKADEHAYFVLKNDVSASHLFRYYIDNQGQNCWEPLGNEAKPFNGTFYGNSYAITGLTISKAFTNNVGLFGYTDGAKIQDLTVSGGDIEGISATGIMVGKATNNTTIENCITTGSVKGYEGVGGIVGSNTYSTVTKSYSQASVDGTSYAGGLVGSNNNYGSVENSYAYGSVITTTKMGGGLVGHNSGTIENCYAIGEVKERASTTDIGGLVGANTGTIKSSYYDATLSGMSDTGKGVGKTTGDMKKQATFVGWDFADCWSIGEGLTYPKRFINHEPKVATPAQLTLLEDTTYLFSKSDFTVKDEDVYDDFALIVQAGTGYKVTPNADGIILDANLNGDISVSVKITDGITGNICTVPITITPVNDAPTLTSATPQTIDENTSLTVLLSMTDAADVDNSLSNASIIIADGAYYTVSGMRITPAKGYIGNLNVGVSVTDGEFTTSTVTMKVTVEDAFEGSGTELDPYKVTTINELNMVRNELDKHYILMNDIDFSKSVYAKTGWEPIGSSIKNSFTGTFKGNNKSIKNLFVDNASSSFVGLFGYINNATISNVAIIDANVTGGDFVGTLIGAASTSNINNCYSTGKVTGKTYVGGLAGYIDLKSSTTTSYSSVKVQGGDRAGGLIGENLASKVENCYATGDVSGGEYLSGLIGVNQDGSTVSNCYSLGLISGDRYTGGFIADNAKSGTYNCFYNSETSNQLVGIGGNSNGFTVEGKTTAEMKTQATFVNWNFLSVYGIKGGSTYPAIVSLDNAPFGFSETISISSKSFYLNNLLDNDFDFETVQSALTLKIDSLSAGSVVGDSIILTGVHSDTIVNVTYRVGEVRANDTLWGNSVRSSLTYDNATSIKEIAPMVVEGYSLTVAPTPTKDSGKLLVVSEENGEAIFTLFTSSSRKLAVTSKKVKADDTNEFNWDVISKLKPDVYFVEMKINGVVKAISKIVKIKE